VCDIAKKNPKKNAPKKFPTSFERWGFLFETIYNITQKGRTP
jgi:hypothetical protein